MKKTTIKAFTLVEMLIVIVIIGILAAALIPRLQGMQARARDTARKADLSQIGTALAAYNADNGSFPSAAGTIGSGGTTEALISPYVSEGFGDPDSARNWKGISLDGTTCPDLAGGVYGYVPLSRRGISNQSFVLMAGTEEGGSSSNWVFDATNFGTDGCITNNMDISSINSARCDSVSAGATNLSGCIAAENLDVRRYIYSQ